MAFPALLALGHEPDDGTAIARLNGGRVRFANKQAVRAREQLAVIVLLTRLDLTLLKGRQALQQLLRTG